MHGCNGWWRQCRGFSVTEVTTILTALTILSGAAAPAVNDYVEDAKLIRVRSDVRTLSVTMVRLFNDVAGERSRDGGWAGYQLLVGAGAAPQAGSVASKAWSAAVDGSTVGLLDDQLITNTAGYSAYGTRGRMGWRGAYLQDAVAADPWGQRYGVNVAAMKSRHDDTVALSAGPDGLVGSAFEHDGLPTAGDDVVGVVSSGGMSTGVSRPN